MSASLKKHSPLFIERCQKCRGERKQEAGLRLDSAEGLLDGGENGRSSSPDPPEKSRLFQAALRLGNLEMPPTQLATIASQTYMAKPSKTC